MTVVRQAHQPSIVFLGSRLVCLGVAHAAGVDQRGGRGDGVGFGLRFAVFGPEHGDVVALQGVGAGFLLPAGIFVVLADAVDLVVPGTEVIALDGVETELEEYLGHADEPFRHVGVLFGTHVRVHLPDGTLQGC